MADQKQEATQSSANVADNVMAVPDHAQPKPQDSSGPNWVDRILLGLMVAIPISVAGHFLRWSDLAVFLTAALSLLPLAKWVGSLTEELAVIAGPTIGGLMNATFGNSAELIIGLIALRAGLIEVVKASITGSIIGNLLLVAGLSMFLGGVRYQEQSFRSEVARVNASVMNLAVVALLLPTAIHFAAPDLDQSSIRALSSAVGIVLIVVYILTLVFSLKTHSYLYRIYETELDEADLSFEEPNPLLSAEGSIPQVVKETPKHGNLWVLLAGLLGVGALLAVESELLVGTLESVLEELSITPLFLGVILLPMLGNAAEHTAAVTVAIKNKMDLSLSVAVGSTMQIALFVAPLLVLAGSLFGQPMDLSFELVELVAVAVGVLLINSVSSDGRSNWLEGLLLLATYVILAIGFFYLPDSTRL